MSPQAGQNDSIYNLHKVDSNEQCGTKTVLSQRISSDEGSGETEPSDPTKWFVESNANPGPSFGPRSMDRKLNAETYIPVTIS